MKKTCRERGGGGQVAVGARLDLKRAEGNSALLFQAGTVSLGWAKCGWALRMTTPTSIRQGTSVAPRSPRPIMSPYVKAYPFKP